jgi:putative two-component system protein, hydrogenase maturation factor HypX/HoxX
MGLLDAAFGETAAEFLGRVEAQMHDLASGPQPVARLQEKGHQRRRDEARRPRSTYRLQELARVHRSFYGPDPTYHGARRRFVHKLPPDGPATVRRLRGPFGVDPARGMTPGASA